MFAQVACGKCGKPFQVPPAQVGQPVPCPWCRELAVAVPVAGVEPLALPDDAPPVPATAPAVTPPRSWPRLIAVTVLSLVTLVVAYFGSQYYRGSVPGFVWQRFDAPDGTCRVDLPGTAVEADRPANPESPITRAGKTFTAGSTFSRVGGFVGWYDLDPAQAKSEMTRPEDVLAAEQKRRQTETGWEVEAATAAKYSGGDPNAKTVQEKFRSFAALEVRYTSGGRKYVEKYVFVATGAKPRLYVFGVGGGGFEPEGPAAQRVMNSFWFDEKK